MYNKNTSNNSFYESMDTNQRPNANFLTGGLSNNSNFQGSPSISNFQAPHPMNNNSFYQTPLQQVNNDSRYSNKLKRAESVHVRNNDPPTKSLRDARPYLTNGLNRNNLMSNPNLKVTHPYAYPSTMKPKYDNKDIDFDHWITIFGYEKKDTQDVLAMFSNVGRITDKRISNTANYMHLRYENKMHAISSRNKNGYLFNSSTMIGVKPCTDIKLVDDEYNFNTNGGLKYGPLKGDEDKENKSDMNKTSGLRNLVTNNSDMCRGIDRGSEGTVLSNDKTVHSGIHKIKSSIEFGWFFILTFGFLLFLISIFYNVFLGKSLFFKTVY